MACISETGTRRAVFQRRAIKRTAARSADIHSILDLGANRFFKSKANLLLYRNAEWNQERIPESDIAVGSMLAMLRLGQTKRVVDPATGERRLEDTDLVRRARAEGMSE